MALPEGPSAAAAVTSPTLDLKWSLTLRVVTVALLCFVIAAAITLVGTYRDVHRANRYRDLHHEPAHRCRLLLGAWRHVADEEPRARITRKAVIAPRVPIS